MKLGKLNWTEFFQTTTRPCTAPPWASTSGTICTSWRGMTPTGGSGGRSWRTVISGSSRARPSWRTSGFRFVRLPFCFIYTFLLYWIDLSLYGATFIDAWPIFNAEKAIWGHFTHCASFHQHTPVTGTCATKWWQSFSDLEISLQSRVGIFWRFPMSNKNWIWFCLWAKRRLSYGNKYEEM